MAHASRSQRGLTLTELAVAMAVAGVLMAAGYGIFLSQQKTYAVQDQVVEIQQNARIVMNILGRDLRMAGHGQPEGPVTIDGVDYQDAVTIDADRAGLTLVGCFGAPEGSLTRTALKGDTQIDLDDTSAWDREDLENCKHIFIGEYDKSVITRVEGNTLTLSQGLKRRCITTRLTADATRGDTEISVASTDGIHIGDMLTLGDERLYVTGTTATTIEFDTDPTTPTLDPLANEYESPARVNPIPVYRVQVIRYDLDESDWTMDREDLAGLRHELAGNIHGLEIEPGDPNHPIYEVEVTAETDVADDQGINRSRTYAFTVRCRNL